MTKDEFDGLAQAADHLPWVETTGGSSGLVRMAYWVRPGAWTVIVAMNHSQRKRQASRV